MAHGHLFRFSSALDECVQSSIPRACCVDGGAPRRHYKTTTLLSPIRPSNFGRIHSPFLTILVPHRMVIHINMTSSTSALDTRFNYPDSSPYVARTVLRQAARQLSSRGLSSAAKWCVGRCGTVCLSMMMMMMMY